MLEAWLAAGPPPVYLGFGSMPVLDAKSLLDTARRALRLVGARGVVSAGWSQLLEPSDPDLYVVDAVDHAALFGRCVAAVHHGGSGTTFASLRAGLPTLVCSVFADQPLWGARCRQLGVGDTLPFAALGTKSLTAGLRTLLREDTRAQTQQLAMRLATERGLENIVELLEQRLPSARAPE